MPRHNQSDYVCLKTILMSRNQSDYVITHSVMALKPYLLLITEEAYSMISTIVLSL
jgi:hypothetical protein